MSVLTLPSCTTETDCVSALLGESESLPAGQRHLLQPFESRARGTEVKESVTAMRFAERPLKRRKEEHQDRIESRCAIYPTNL
ncbi:hypothetical protein Pcac1_g5880 [Phytophthora cactorum]|uniref:Uncharacterized protein n=1 Tax=Phytophthora cactorum TaxID=29920 RepID=A0A8T1CML5_9STRA|nr:hypothetical protein Pcac1_g5880 [Phytophthora cactorum]KAG2924539.1 hypothetical protein PC117_g15389 [Phytophthora cactorum]KAG3004611.1 hypothetical protein PC119_g15566 [Phytophthora cactorum]